MSELFDLTGKKAIITAPKELGNLIEAMALQGNVISVEKLMYARKQLMKLTKLARMVQRILGFCAISLTKLLWRCC